MIVQDLFRASRIALITSDYSKKCQMLDQKISNTELDISRINIDHEDIRNIVCSCPLYKIKVVPCILVFLTDGNVEKYEGLDAFNWVSQIETSSPQAPANTSVMESFKVATPVNKNDAVRTEPSSVTNTPAALDKLGDASTSIDYIDDDDDEHDNEVEYVPQSLKNSSRAQVKIQNTQQPQTMTDETELSDDPSGMGESSNKNSKTIGDSKNMLMEEALKMQKERGDDDPDKIKPGML